VRLVVPVVDAVCASSVEVVVPPESSLLEAALPLAVVLVDVHLAAARQEAVALIRVAVLQEEERIPEGKIPGAEDLVDEPERQEAARREEADRAAARPVEAFLAAARRLEACPVVVPRPVPPAVASSSVAAVHRACQAGAHQGEASHRAADHQGEGQEHSWWFS
jgi:hypothetical protein